MGLKVFLTTSLALTMALFCFNSGDAADKNLGWSTFLGGGTDDLAYGLAVDDAGYVYLAGETTSLDFPTTAGAFDSTRDNYAAFVTKLDPTASSLVYSTFLGGTSTDYGEDMALDAENNVFVVGYTLSNDFPVTPGAFDTTHNGSRDAFVAKLNAAGSALEYATYLGGSDYDYGYGIAIDTLGHAYITGNTESDDFPTTSGALDGSFNGGYYGDAFVARFNATGTALEYATYLGGTDNDWGRDIAADNSGYAYITGYTESDDFPATAGALDESFNGGYHPDAFVARLNPSGSALIYCTFLGGGDEDRGYAITIDDLGNAYVAGYTESDDFPTTAAAYDTTLDPSRDAFVIKLNSAGSDLEYGTFIGGDHRDVGYGIFLNAAGDVYVAGYTRSEDFPTTANAVDNTHNGQEDAFVVQLDPALSVLEYATYLGGSYDDVANRVFVDASGNIYLAGETYSEDFPTTDGAFDNTYNNQWDIFVAKLGPGIEVTHGAIDGTVSEAKGPITGATVTARGPTIASATTNASGYYIIDDLPTGTYDVTASAVGYSPSKEENVVVTEDDTSAVDFSLSPFSGGDKLVWSTFLGGGTDDLAYGLAVDDAGYVYLAGETTSLDFPTTAGAFDSTRDNYAAFVTKLDPTASSLVYSTFLGGTSTDYGEDMALDAENNVFVVGYTLSNDFPVTPGAFDTTHNGSRDAFVAKLNAAGSALEYATYLGGSDYDYGYGIAIDTLGHAYITGNTESDDFPTTSGALDGSFNGGYYGDAFVARFNATGTALEYATYLGGTDNDWGRDIAADNSGYAYITGYTESDDFPATAGALDESFNGGYHPDAFVARLNPSGSALIYCTFLGGGDEDRGYAITIDDLGNAYVAGYTESDDFPTTAAAYDTTLDPSRDAFVIKLNSAGSDLEYGTFIGGDHRDVGYGIFLNAAGDVYVAGYTRSEDFPTTANAVDNTHNGQEDAFVVQLDPALSVLEYATYLGGSYDDVANRVFVDASGNIYLAGETYSEDFPTTDGAFDNTYNNQWDIFVAQINPLATPVELTTRQPGLPKGYALSQNYPNPFNPETTIRFEIPGACPVSLRIYNVRGQLVRDLIDGPRQAGSYEIRWDGRNDQGHLVPSGIYFCRMKTGSFAATRKMALIK